MFAFIIFSVLSLFYTEDLVDTKLGNVIVLCIGLFWAFRAILQIVYFKLKKKMSVIIFLLFCVGAFLYLYPWYLIERI